MAAVEVDFLDEATVAGDATEAEEDLVVKSVDVIVAALAVVGGAGAVIDSPFTTEAEDDPLVALSSVVVEIARVVVDAVLTGAAICNNDTSVFVDLSAVVVAAAATVLVAVGTEVLATDGVAEDVEEEEADKVAV